MDLNARVNVNCGRKDGRTDGLTDGRKTERLYHTLLKQVRQKLCRVDFVPIILFLMENPVRKQCSPD